MADRLVVDGEEYKYCLRWDVDGEWGMTLGEERAVGPEPSEPEAWQNWMAYQVCLKSEGVHQSSQGFFWETKKHATAALQAIKLAWKGKRPLADWECKALAAGWTPPK